jgi:hypothetical protein
MFLEFYDGQSVFATGTTGFVGKCMLEKLLRDTKVPYFAAFLPRSDVTDAKESMTVAALNEIHRPFGMCAALTVHTKFHHR